MHFNIITLFPEMFPGTLGGGVVGRALANGLWSMNIINLRDFATDNYGAVDDAQFGGGAGQVMRADIIAAAIDSIRMKEEGRRMKIIYFSPRGKLLNQKIVRESSADSRLHPSSFILLCGRFEGIDQRVIDEYDITEISIGDYILSGGEIAAQVFIDSLVRLIDNVVHSPESVANESFEIGGLEWPLYTRPSSWRGRNVPEVLMSGHHGNIERWRKQQSDDITKQRRPDLVKSDM
ncbi:MAG: tRNA (guanosine(37)-N1)-methyltransferase TrmD [Rickettsiales bacterium]|jgi:tRNA (guanine37-N1)-methyltransferase|nr:tRNA (guanosine(37)-N1)-methyltransferase TrmD [Rickettsiales bacterium]